MQCFVPAKQGRTVPCHRVQLPELQVVAGSPVGPQATAQHPRAPAAGPSQGPPLLARQPELVSLVNPTFAPLRMLLLFQSFSCFATCLFTCRRHKRPCSPCSATSRVPGLGKHQHPWVQRWRRASGATGCLLAQVVVPLSSLVSPLLVFCKEIF